MDCRFAGVVARMDEANSREDWAAVVELGKEAEKDRAKVTDKEARGKCMSLVFQALRAQDELVALASHMQREAEQFHEFAMYEAEGMKLQNLGNLHMELVDSNLDTTMAASKCYERAREIAEQGAFLSLQSQSAVGMSDLANLDGRPDEALELARHALTAADLLEGCEPDGYRPQELMVVEALGKIASLSLERVNPKPSTPIPNPYSRIPKL